MHVCISSAAKVGDLGFDWQWLPRHFFSHFVSTLIYHQLQFLPRAPVINQKCIHVYILISSCTCNKNCTCRQAWLPDVVFSLEVSVVGEDSSHQAQHRLGGLGVAVPQPQQP